jgi:hypothetical protein
VGSLAKLTLFWLAVPTGSAAACHCTRFPDLAGDLPIHVAVRSGKLAGFRRLADAGAAPRAKGAKGGMVLHVAAARGRGTLMEPLAAMVDVGAVDDEGCTAMEIALRTENRDVVEALAKYILLCSGCLAAACPRVDKERLVVQLRKR